MSRVSVLQSIDRLRTLREVSEFLTLSYNFRIGSAVRRKGVPSLVFSFFALFPAGRLAV